MKKISFTIHGNQKNPDGNPIPYKRTLAGKFRRDSIDYMQWKEFVRSELDRSAQYVPTSTSSYPYHDICAPGEVAVVSIWISWRDHKGGDGDNIFKGIADALFANDKCIEEGHFYTGMSLEKKGSVLVEIYVYTREEYIELKRATLERVP